MADFSVTGFVNVVKYLDDSCVLYVDEFRKGYTKSNGEKIEDAFFTWRCIFKGYFKKFISSHFSRGMLVQVKGEIRPFSIEHGKLVEGYSVIGQCVNLASYPKQNAKSEIKMIKESMAASGEEPDIETYMQDDF